MKIADVLIALASCLCEQIQTDESPAPCFCGVIPGDSAIQEYAGDCDGDGCGMAWVRLVTSYPSATVGQAVTTQGNCGANIGADVEIGIMRCISAEEVPNEAELLESFDQQMKDMETMRRALLCCSTLNSKDFILGSYRPTGPIGGLVGGTWTIYLAT